MVRQWQTIIRLDEWPATNYIATANQGVVRMCGPCGTRQPAPRWWPLVAYEMTGANSMVSQFYPLRSKSMLLYSGLENTPRDKAFFDKEGRLTKDLR